MPFATTFLRFDGNPWVLEKLVGTRSSLVIKFKCFLKEILGISGNIGRNGRLSGRANLIEPLSTTKFQ